VYLVHPVDLAAVVQNALGKGGFAGVDVSADADVAHLFQFVFHEPYFLFPLETTLDL
jgi:hypothetical protein